LALYRITVDGKETYILVMRSVFGSRLKIHKKYDLKGSTVDRQASNKEKVNNTEIIKGIWCFVQCILFFKYLRYNAHSD
jgi:1-phosphatidylinositol-5-phosphate 4-kinase